MDDYFEIATSQINSLDEFTLSFWIKPEFLPTGNNFDTRFIIGQKEMFEIILGPGGDNTPRIWTKHHYGSGLSANGTGHLINDTDWMNYTVTVDYITEIIKIYVNGAFITNMGMNGPRLTNSNPFRIGSKKDSQPGVGENFEGWIDEVKLFDTLLTSDQIQQMIYQEIENNVGNVHGVVIDQDISDSTTNATIPWSNLIAYYPFTNIKSGKVIDESGNGFTATLHFMNSLLQQSTPMPYETSSDGPWTTEGTWLHGNVWDIENVTTNKPWSIVQIHDNVTTSSSHTQLGMFIDSGKTFTVNGDNAIINNGYLQLDGTIDLADDSQLVQGPYSDLVTSATGKILRRQEGNANKFWYNYWTSPVGSLAASSLTDNNGSGNNANNTPFSLNMLKDGAGSNIQFTNAFDEVGKVSTEWLHTFQNGITYFNWNQITPITAIQPGVGYTQKGTGNAGTEQQYLFEGKPNNGTILVAADDVSDAMEVVDGESKKDVTLTTTLIGNPYPSALDAIQFINDNKPGTGNGSINGTIILWEQWAGTSHYLSTYEGGYAYINLLTPVRAYQHADIPIVDQVITQGIKTPTNFLPVGQGFFVEVISDTGDIEFNNGQRVFKKEDLGESVFYRSSNSDIQASAEESAAETQILRLEFGVSSGASRSFVLGFTEDATDGYDYGLDGGLINDPPADDMGSLLNGEQYVIQAFAPYTPDKEIDLVLHASGNFTYTLKSTEISNFPEDQDLFIKDNLTGQNYDLRSAEPYNFTSVSGSFTDRFQVVFQDPAALSTENFITDNTLIYINQTEDKLYVKQLTDQAREVSFTNMLGQSIKTFSSVNNQALENGIDISKLRPGVYVVSIKTVNDQSIDKKVIIN